MIIHSSRLQLLVRGRPRSQSQLVVASNGEVVGLALLPVGLPGGLPEGHPGLPLGLADLFLGNQASTRKNNARFDQPPAGVGHGGAVRARFKLEECLDCIRLLSDFTSCHCSS